MSNEQLTTLAEPTAMATAIAGPRRWPLVGNIPQLASGILAESLYRLVQRHGDVFRVVFPPKTYAVIAHPDGIKEVTTELHDKTKRPHLVMAGADLWGTDSFYLNDGDKWLDRRKRFNRAFSAGQLGRLVSATNECTDVVIERLDDAAARNEPLDIRAQILRLCIDVTGRFLYGHELGAQRGDGEYDECLSHYWAHVTWRNLIPFKYYKLLPTPEYRRKQRGLAKLEGLVRTTLEARRRQPLVDNQLDPISIMLKANQSTSPEPEPDGATCPVAHAEFSEKEFRDELMLFMQAGVEPFAPMLYWTLLFLCEHPDQQAKVAAEAARVLGTSTRPTTDDLAQLVHCDAVLRESTRLRAPVVAFYRGLTEDITVMGRRIPKEWDIWIPAYAVHRDPRFWDAPLEFRPERWLDGKPMHRFQYLAFGAGPRNCPGEHVSMVSCKLFVSRLCERFKLSVQPGARLKMENGGFLQLRSPLPLRVERRAR